MCRVLEVAESGFYAWRKRPASPSLREDAQRRRRDSTGISRSLWQIREPAPACGAARSGTQHRSQTGCKTDDAPAGLCAKRKRKRVLTTHRDPSHPVAPNLLNREFTAQEPNKKWVTDITYIPTMQGWLYLAVILDLYSRMVVGWSMGGEL
jgi:putative transposase